MPLLIRYCTTEIARAAESSQFDGNAALAIGRTSVWPSTRSTQATSVGICLLQLGERGRELVELGAALGLDRRRAGIEEHFRLEHEAVADDADVRPIAEDRAQPAEELRAEARELLHALGQREVEPLAEIGDARLRFLVLALGRFQRVFDRGKLAAQRGDLLVEQFDLRHRARRDALLRVELAGELVRPRRCRSAGRH